MGWADNWICQRIPVDPHLDHSSPSLLSLDIIHTQIPSTLTFQTSLFINFVVN